MDKAERASAKTKKKNNARIYQQKKGERAKNYTQVLREVRPWL